MYRSIYLLKLFRLIFSIFTLTICSNSLPHICSNIEVFPSCSYQSPLFRSYFCAKLGWSTFIMFFALRHKYMSHLMCCTRYLYRIGEVTLKLGNPKSLILQLLILGTKLFWSSFLFSPSKCIPKVYLICVPISRCFHLFSVRHPYSVRIIDQNWGNITDSPRNTYT